MRKIRQVLRLAWEGGLGQRQIARSLSISPTTVGEYLRRASVGGLSWPLHRDPPSSLAGLDAQNPARTINAKRRLVLPVLQLHPKPDRLTQRIPQIAQEDEAGGTAVTRHAFALLQPDGRDEWIK